MHCSETMKRLDAWVDNELEPQEAESVDRHLGHCPACRLEAAGISQIKASLDAMPEIHAPAGLSHRTLAAFRAGMERPGLIQWWQGLTLAMRSAVCGTAMAGLVCGAVLCTAITTSGYNALANPYHTLYDSKGILP